MVTVVNWDRFEYVYSDHADTAVIDFPSPDDVIMPGGPGMSRMYNFLLGVGKSWQAPDDGWGYSYNDSIVDFGTVDVPAGSFDEAFKIQRTSQLLVKGNEDSPQMVARMEWYERRIGMLKLHVEEFYDAETVIADWELIEYNIEY